MSAGTGNNDGLNDINGSSNDSEDGLGGFISNQLRMQERESKEADNLDTQKRDDFISRALAESKRMNKEIEKSQVKQDKLRTEFGADRLNEWRNEHAAEVLTPEQQALIAKLHD